MNEDFNLEVAPDSGWYLHDADPMMEVRSVHG